MPENNKREILLKITLDFKKVGQGQRVFLKSHCVNYFKLLPSILMLFFSNILRKDGINPKNVTVTVEEMEYVD